MDRLTEMHAIVNYLYSQHGVLASYQRLSPVWEYVNGLLTCDELAAALKVDVNVVLVMRQHYIDMEAK